MLNILLPIETPELLLRKFRPEDGEGLYAYLSDPETVYFEPYGPLTREQACAEAQARAQSRCFVAVERAGVLIGHLYFAVNGDCAELGYVFSPAYQGHGYATQAARALMNAAFSAGLQRVTAECALENPRSWHLLERLGMRRVSETPHNVCFKQDASGNDLWWTRLEYEIRREV